jgi:hypothetical protein
LDPRSVGLCRSALVIVGILVVGGREILAAGHAMRIC